MKKLPVLAIGLATLLAGGCSGGSDTSADQHTSVASTTTHPSVAVSVAPPSAQNNATGRAAVTFDPCVDVGDSTIQKLGFDPSTRQRNDLSADTYTFLGCGFEHKTSEGWTDWSLSILATNITMSEVRDKYKDTARDVTMSGRSAVTYTLSTLATGDTCFLAMDSSVGVLNLQLDLNPARATGKPCDRIQQIAEALQQDLPKK
ncbi:DUF3558 domain-containing protein [Nocardia terpenica]|uniref:DUF3558 domain-containing protein n=1 Tax=Nocardia terpenica TaxID=455432 RepID=A0A6G9Z0B6_9NOCA|nr:DUF3558 domain-containing protein [Nocardia terpenica]QIS18902.1 DUF3558 domain-containing protein [Nocardia terpenica]